MHIGGSIGTPGPPLITIEDAARVLNVSRSTACRAATAGQIPTVRLGRRLLVPSALLRRMLGWDTGEAREVS